MWSGGGIAGHVNFRLLCVYDGWLRWLAFIGEGAGLGVDLFLVLTGYLITGILLDTVKRPHYYRNFIARRTLRIFPAPFTIAARLSPASWAALQAWGGVSWVFIYLGNIRAAWVNDLPPVFASAPLWLLQVEEQFYLLYPLVVASIIGAAAVVVMFLVALRYQRFGTAFPPFMRSIDYSIIDITSAAVLSFIVLSPTSKLAAVLRWRPLVYTGQIAYGLSLLHRPASWIARKLIALLTTVTVELHSALSIPITFAASFIVAGLSWRLFESPMLASKENVYVPKPIR